MSTYDFNVPGAAREGTAVPSRRAIQIALLLLAVFALLGAGDENARFSMLGHKLMCVCSCNQVLLECNHVGCSYSDRMRGELAAALDRADSDDLVLQSFVQKCENGSRPRIVFPACVT